MKKIALLLYTLFFSTAVLSQGNISIGKEHKIFSKALNEERTVWVYLPKDYNNEKFSPAKYPVVYLLDAENSFHSFTGMQQSLERGPYASIPQMIVVGITNTNRTRDLTPTKVGIADSQDKRQDMFQDSGGNTNFIQFLEKELRPYIDSNYSSSGYSILNGHSFGGLTATNILLNHPDLFNAYIIIDPSLWWDNELMSKQAEALQPHKDFKNRTVYMAMANERKASKDGSTSMMKSIRKFDSILDYKKPKNLRLKLQLYENENHGTIPIPAAYDGLRFIFREHLINVKEATQNPSVVEEQFKKLSKDIGFNMFPTENYLSWMANYCIRTNHVDQGITFFKIAAKLYPESNQVKEALARAIHQKEN
ncbi:alpha/beta hydrolase [Flavobacterium algicola]|uniref:alpha/beta hydrolase n=1 Tax=Flavobacterium algicola TaxID=556529 RepID=UPI001EFCD715|nr:alpha/beta hydrolase-fold protein [Flavobacterium algicola]MCG9792857.1 alpha/beta hydrolase [Flavobacterium algicola]